MSIKKLFDSANKNKQYSDYKTDQEAFESVESADNAAEIVLKEGTYVPPLDYAEPTQFVRFGSAYYYYKGALSRISDYYPYDGSDAEKNKFYNGLLEVEKYIFDNKYPKTTGYINLSVDGWGSRSSIGVDGYGLPTTQEYITFKGGPLTSSGTSLVDQGPNPYSDKIHYANIYDENIYQTAGLPSNYGSGTRLSNLRANLDDGVTLEFWLKSGSMTHADTTQKQVIFDWWNNEDTSSADYGRILIELTSSTDIDDNFIRPFLVTVQSGACTTKDFVSLGSSSLAWADGGAPLGSWGHYAIRMYNSASALYTELFVDGALNDTAIKQPYDLSSSIGARAWPTAIDKSYSSSDTLQAWWRLNTDLTSGGTVTDHSGKGRNADFAAVADYPSAYSTSVYPSAYIQASSNTFDGTDSKIRTSGSVSDGWEPVIGTSGTSKYSISTWVRSTSISTRKLIEFGNNNRIHIDAAGRAIFTTTWNSAMETWQTGTGVITVNTWHHIVVTYDAGNDSNDPAVYVDGVLEAVTTTGTAPTGTWNGVGSGYAYIAGQTFEWIGQIADVAIWNSILSAAEVESIYKAASILAAFSTFTELNSKAAMGRIGALQTSPPGIAATAGAGKLTGSLDEFRYWKVSRNSQQIAQNYFVPVNGGTNTDISNTTLGVYYKFNEGIVGTAAEDSIVLDYAGRLSNGAWTGYPGSTARNTGSAIVLASAASREYLDPIIRKANPEFTALSSSLLASGSWYDQNNNSQFLNYVPSWVIEEHDKLGNQNLEIISHIMGSYFDKLYFLASEIPKLRQINYTTSSHKPIPFADHLPQSLGMSMPEVFIDASVMENLLDRTDTTLFESDLNDTKNLIYLNLYNNLTNIYKSKGTAKAIRNVMRCFYLDDSLFRLTTYSTNNTYELRNNVVQHLAADKAIDFNTEDNYTATIYQRENDNNPESKGFISGSGIDPDDAEGFYQKGGPCAEDPYGFTTEASILFPYYNSTTANDKVDRSFVSCSLFGLHTVNTTSQASMTGSDPSLVAYDYANFQVFAARTRPHSKNVTFILSSSLTDEATGPIPELTSSVFFNVYDDETWNLSVRVKPVGSGVKGFVTGSASGSYDVIFRGASTKLGVIDRNFEVSGTVNYLTGTMLSRAPKRIYAGARRQNINGATVLQKSDVRLLNVRHWMKHIDSSSLDMHAFDANNHGISASYQNISALPISSNLYGRHDLLNLNTLALEWPFDQVTGSDSSGNFIIVDNSSGSALIRDNYGWLGAITGYQHSGYGYGFATSSTTVVDERETNMFKFIDPENAVGTDMIQILSEDDKVFGVVETVPSYLFTLEKSMYQAISEEMLKFFAGVVDFNNVIGAPVNRYRSRYKDLEKLRESFFRRVTTTSDVEKFVEYYKWFDDALASVLAQLMPASADFVEDVLNTIESHVLERHKYQSQFPTLEAMPPDLDTSMTSEDLAVTYGLGSTTLPTSPRDTTKHAYFWKNVAIRTGSLVSEIGSGNPTIDSQRDTIKNVVSSEPALSGTLPVLSTVGGVKYQRNTLASRRFQRFYRISADSSYLTGSSFKGGTNFNASKNIDFTYNALRPAGPVNQDSDVYVPQNVLLALAEDLEDLPNINDPPNIPSAKVKRFVKVQHGRNWQEGLGYSNVSSKIAFPFNLISSSLNTGYQKDVSERVSGSILITNLHNDVYGPAMEKPMQGPFTEYAVGGHQSRHVSLNTGSDNYRNRPEAWKLLLGTCTFQSGAIGMVGPDYPWPEANDEGATPYPMTASQKAIYYRDYIAKRPVNIRNIHYTTGSTILGNYNNKYDVVSTFGAYSNPLAFREVQPTLPANVLQLTATSSTTAETLLGIHRTDDNHFEFVAPYSVAYLTGASSNQTVIRNRFGAPGGIETAAPAYNDFRSNEYSVYNTINNRNLTVRKPWQGPSGTYSQPTGTGPTGIRVSDIHGKDYGLVSQLSRHTARFGRDSLFVTSAGNLPGASYTQLPGFHKVHRNNIGRIKKTDSIVITESTPLNNTKCVNYITDQSVSGTAMVLSGAGTFGDQGAKLYQALTSSGFTYSGWLYFSAGASVRRFFNLGRTQNGSHPGIAIAKTYISSEHRIRVSMATRVNDSATSYTLARWHCSGSAPEEWMHIAVAWTGSDASVSSADPVVYINGTSQAITEDTAPLDYYPDTWRSSQSYKNFSEVEIAGDNMVILGGNHSNTNYEFSGSMDELSIWNRVLNSAEITEIYNSGIPCDITASNTYASSSSDLWEWIRMGDGSGTNAIALVNPGVLVGGNKITGEINSFQFLPICKSGSSNPMNINTSSPTILAGCVAKITDTTEISTYSTGSLYDNFYIKHQIPRSSQQYSWITASLVSNKGRYGFTPANYKISNSSGIVDAYDLLTASNAGSYLSLGTNRIYGQSLEEVNSDSNLTQFMADNLTGLNINFFDPVDINTNTLGVGDNITNYFNTGSYLDQVTAFGKALGLNGLLLKRGGGYGYNSWTQLRQDNHPLVRYQKRNNKLAININSTTTEVFEMPPVSLRGRPGIVNFSSGDSIYTLQATFTNDRIYFNSSDLDNKLDISLTNFTTPFEQAIQIARQYNINWVKYTQNIFPSSRNEFMSRSTQRLGYDNKSWRNTLGTRLTVGSALSNSCGVWDDPITTGNSYTLSQSCWPLDAPVGFLTRSNADNWNATASLLSFLSAPGEAMGNLSVAGGELQNGYSTYFANSLYGEGMGPALWTQLLYRPAALYARKHQLTTPASNVGPTGIKLPETGSINRSIFLAKNQCSGTFAGEAVWQAGSLAGVVRKVGSENTNTFLFSSSAPWYNSYDDFNADLKLLTRGYSTIPEFRISPHVSDYLEAGTIDNGKTDAFEVVGTGINSSTITNGTASFYLDYSNSEFLEDFLSIKQDSLLNAVEIKMVCSAACKFVPYKGFYPADRTLQLVEQFKKDYANTMNGTALRGSTEFDKSGDGDLFAGPWGGFTKMGMAPLFNPGILYNSIKSGLAVDWPLVTQGSKFQKVYYGQLGQFDLDNAQNWAITCRSGAASTLPLYSTTDMSENATGSAYNQQMLGFNRTFFDTRVPFEGIVYPEQYLDGVNLFDMDAHPSSSIFAATASYAGSPGASYSRMMRNFLGAVPSFFLADDSFSKLSTPAMSETMTFDGDEIYMARLKVYRSMSGSRNYAYESGSTNYASDQTKLFNALGATGLKQVSYDGEDSWVAFVTGTSYPLPQDPRNAPNYRENFTMYSRPTAFGPPIAGLGAGQRLSGAFYTTNTIYDSLSGHNPAYTPPYYDGESWCDLIFRPQANVEYNLARIVAELTSSYLRFDAGYQSGSLTSRDGSSGLAQGCGPRTPLIYTPNAFPYEVTSVPVLPVRPSFAPYGGVNINKNSMQASASLRMFGIETVELTQTDKFGLKDFTRNTSTGQRWVIQPRFETPMLNFNDTGTRPLTSSQLSLPTFASCSVPRGMWHQFGIVEPDQDKGIFMEIGDLPSNWLKYNHLIINTGSIYNKFSTAAGQVLAGNAKSLCELVGFDSGVSKKRLGALKESIKIKEAIVAVPYVLRTSVDTLTRTVKGSEAVPRKQFINIPRARFEASLEAAFGSAEGDSLEAAGSSIRRQIEKMQSYIMPPEFDFIQNTDLEPVAMYIFEFEHVFDQDDLSYIWQNLAPRKKNMTIQYDSVGHELLTTELLSEQNLTENENLRWMIFKVKQRGQEDYYNYLTTEAGKVPYNIANRLSQQEVGTGYNLSYNWPYDYMSFVERIKIDTEILFKNAPGEESPSLTEISKPITTISSTPKSTGVKTTTRAPTTKITTISSTPKSTGAKTTTKSTATAKTKMTSNLTKKGNY